MNHEVTLKRGLGAGDKNRGQCNIKWAIRRREMNHEVI